MLRKFRTSSATPTFATGVVNVVQIRLPEWHLPLLPAPAAPARIPAPHLGILVVDIDADPGVQLRVLRAVVLAAVLDAKVDLVLVEPAAVQVLLGERPGEDVPADGGGGGGGAEGGVEALGAVFPPQTAPRLARRASQKRVGEEFVARNDPRVMGTAGEELREVIRVVVTFLVLQDLPVELHPLGHFDLGELRPHSGRLPSPLSRFGGAATFSKLSFATQQFGFRNFRDAPSDRITGLSNKLVLNSAHPTAKVMEVGNRSRALSTHRWFLPFPLQLAGFGNVRIF